MTRHTIGPNIASANPTPTQRRMRREAEDRFYHEYAGPERFRFRDVIRRLRSVWR